MLVICVTQLIRQFILLLFMVLLPDLAALEIDMLGDQARSESLS